MPFSGPSSYLVTIDEFIGHWTDVNADLSPGNITVNGVVSLAVLQIQRTSLATAMTDLTEGINLWEGHRTDRDNYKAVIREKMRQVGGVVRGMMSSSAYVGQLPDLIRPSDNSGKWITAMDDFEHLWTQINADPPDGFSAPMLLSGGYTLAMFTAINTALRTTFTAVTQTDQDVDRLRDERDLIYFQIRDELVLYRQAVEGMFPAGHPLIESLPRVSPLPGHTPDPVSLSGDWNAGTLKADLSWTASADPDLASYSIRRSGATPYDPTTEVVVDSVLPGVLSLSTNAGLVTPGATMGFKVYVVLSTGNERGSNAVPIEHPL